MAINPSNLRSDFQKAIEDIGQNITIVNFSGGALSYSGADYDEEYLIVASGTTISGLGYLEPISNNTSSAESQFIQQGKLQQNDLRLFVHGSISIFTNSRVKLANGSVYDVLPEGVITRDISGTSIFKKCFVRASTGSDFLI